MLKFPNLKCILFLIIITEILSSPLKFLEEEESCDCSYEVLHQDWSNQTHPTPSSIKSQCSYITKCCEGTYFTILKIHYCNSIPSSITMMIIILLILLCFYILSSTGNDYLANVLGRISEKLKLSQNLAGLTLLALGNQAPDVAVAIVAGGDKNEGFSTALGSLLGGGGLVVGLVCSSVIVLGNGVKVYKGNYVRDIGVYLIAIFIIISFGFFLQKIKFWMAIVIFSIYILYVIICVLMDKEGKKKLENNDVIKSFLGDRDFLAKIYDDFGVQSYTIDSEDNTIESNNDKNNNENNDNIDYKIDENIEDNRLVPEDSVEDIIEDEIERNLLEDNNEQKERQKEKENEKKEKPKKKVKFNLNKHIKQSYYKNRISEGGRQTLKSDNFKMYSKFKYDLIRYYLTTDKTKWEEKTLFLKIIYIILDFPLNFIRDCTIPAFEKEKWKRSMFIFLPISLSIFFTIIFKLYSLYITQYKIIIIYYIICIIISLIFYCKTYRGSLPKAENIILFSSFILSILWIWAVTNILMDMISSIKLLLPIEISESFLSMTVLALGNSLPDFIVDCSLAKTGFAEMALSGAIGAPVFGITFGLGVSLIKKMINEGIDHDLDFNFDLHGKNAETNKIILCGFANLILLLSMLIVMGFVNKFVIKKYVGFFGYAIYTIFILAIVYFTFLEKYF